jgi:hypothetical protein
MPLALLSLEFRPKSTLSVELGWKSKNPEKLAAGRS